MAQDVLKVERDGWFIDIETLDVSRRPHWEIRVLIRRRKDQDEEERRHRFFVPKELADRYELDGMKEARRDDRLARAAKKVILREFAEIFAEPEGGLDSLRPLSEGDLRE